MRNNSVSVWFYGWAFVWITECIAITVQNISETSEKIAPNVIKGKGSIEQYPEWDEEDDDYE